MSEIKICPDCRTEYFPHIERCADCGAVLLTPEESMLAHEEKKRRADEDVLVPVMIRKGSLKWMNELRNVLIDSGIPCVVDAESGCNKGGCAPSYWLLVAPEHVEEAHARIEAYCMEMHPEIRDSRELISQGKCPACGYAAAPDSAQCPDCGLTLVIIEE